MWFSLRPAIEISPFNSSKVTCRRLFRPAAFRWVHYTDYPSILQLNKFTKISRIYVFRSPFFPFYSSDFHTKFSIYSIYRQIPFIVFWFLLISSFLFILFTPHICIVLYPNSFSDFPVSFPKQKSQSKHMFPLRIW